MEKRDTWHGEGIFSRERKRGRPTEGAMRCGLALVVLLVLLLANCGLDRTGGEETPAAVEDENPVADAEETAAKGSETPVNEDGCSKWSLKGLRLGMSEDEVVSLLGDPSEKGNAYEWVYRRKHEIAIGYGMEHEIRRVSVLIRLEEDGVELESVVEVLLEKWGNPVGREVVDTNAYDVWHDTACDVGARVRFSSQDNLLDVRIDRLSTRQLYKGIQALVERATEEQRQGKKKARARDALEKP